jgi:tRNA (guanine37-N1)-methyltransferase
MMRLDVFTLAPQVFAVLTEHRPMSTVLGGELELRLFNYRDFSPLRGGQIDDAPYGGGAGMVMRVDVVAAALQSVYGTERPRLVALQPAGRQLTQSLVEELSQEQELTLLSARFEGFDERIIELCDDVVSLGPYVLSNGDLPALVLADALSRRLEGALALGSGEEESFSVALAGGVEYPHYTRPAEWQGHKVPELLLSGDHARIRSWRLEQSRIRSQDREKQ